MAIQPIDLQNMYSQLSNVAKAVAGQQQAVQIVDSIQQDNQVQKNLDNAKKIQKTNEKANTKNINEDGSNGGTFYGQNNKKSKEKENENTSNKEVNIQSSYLGTIIDITR